MKKPKRNLVSTVHNMQINNKPNTKGKTGQTSKNSNGCRCRKRKDNFKLNTNLIEMPKTERYQLDQQNKENIHLTNRGYLSPFDKIDMQKLIRSKSHTKLHGEKYRDVTKPVIKPIDGFGISSENQNQEIKFQENIINYIKSIEKNVNDLKQCVFHNRTPNKQLPSAKRTTESLKTILMKQSCKSVVNLRTVYSSNRLNAISSKNIKNKRKDINTYSNKNHQKKSVSNNYSGKMPSIKRIRDLYRQKYGDQTTNIVDLYNFYVSLEGRQPQIQQKKNYASSHAQNYLLENNSEEYLQKQEYESIKGYNPCFVLDIDSIELEEDSQHQIDSVTTEFSKTKKTNNKIAQIKELVDYQNADRSIYKKESRPFKNQPGILNPSLSNKSQNKLVRLETRDLFFFDLIQQAQQQLETNIKSRNVLPGYTQPKDIINPGQRRSKEPKESSSQIPLPENTRQKFKLSNYKGDQIDQYIEQCIKINDRVLHQRTLVCAIPPMKGVLFTSFDLQEIDSTPQNLQNNMQQYQGERDKEYTEKDEECHPLSAENYIQKHRYLIEAINETEYRKICSEPNNELRERVEFSPYEYDNSV